METLSQIFTSIGTALLAVLTFFGGPDPTPRFQGYVEADYVRVAPRDSGTLERLGVARGDRVAIGDALFGLDDDAELAARDEARARLTQAEAHLDDLQKGKRAPEINAILAQKAQADASLKLAETQLKRQEGLIGSPAAARDRLDEARATAERDRARVAELTHQLQTARLSARDDEIRAAAAASAQTKAALDQAEWRLGQRSAVAPVAGRVVDTLYVAGEFVNAGSPVVSILPAANVKIRFFVPEAALGRIQVGAQARIVCDGCPEPIAARVTFVAPQAEYTPPVIYSMESRDKLVFLVEARPVATEARLNPGQPVDVTLQP